MTRWWERFVLQNVHPVCQLNVARLMGKADQQPFFYTNVIEEEP